MHSILFSMLMLISALPNFGLTIPPSVRPRAPDSSMYQALGFIPNPFIYKIGDHHRIEFKRLPINNKYPELNPGTSPHNFLHGKTHVNMDNNTAD